MGKYVKMHSICTFACVLVNAFQKKRPCSRPRNPLKELFSHKGVYLLKKDNVLAMRLNCKYIF